MFVSNKPFGSLLEISPTNHIFLKTFNSEIKVWFKDQNSKPLEIEDKTNLTVVINEDYKNEIHVQLNWEIEYMWKDMDFYLLLKTRVNVWAINTIKNLIALKNLQQMQ